MPPDTAKEKMVDERRVESIQHDSVVLKSDHDSLGIWQTVCKFKKVGGSKEY